MCIKGPVSLRYWATAKKIEKKKKSENGKKKVFKPAFVCKQHPKAGQNIQQLHLNPCIWDVT